MNQKRYNILVSANCIWVVILCGLGVQGMALVIGAMR